MVIDLNNLIGQQILESSNYPIVSLLVNQCSSLKILMSSITLSCQNVNMSWKYVIADHLWSLACTGWYRLQITYFPDQVINQYTKNKLILQPKQSIKELPILLKNSLYIEKLHRGTPPTQWFVIAILVVGRRAVSCVLADANKVMWFYLQCYQREGYGNSVRKSRNRVEILYKCNL